jgi:hypothetical protein
MTVIAADRRQYPGNVDSLDNRTHQVVFVVSGIEIGPYPQPWEGRCFRVAAQGLGGFTNPDGSVRCVEGEWRIDEITDPDLVAQFNASVKSNKMGWRLGEPIPPGLWPEGW